MELVIAAVGSGAPAIPERFDLLTAVSPVWVFRAGSHQTELIRASVES
jgi:hypothetical protein